MEKVKQEVECAKETLDVGLAVENLLDSIQAAGKDGYQLATDVPAVILANLNTLTAAISGMDKIPAEAKEDTLAFVNALYVPITRAAFKLLKKPAPVA